MQWTKSSKKGIWIMKKFWKFFGFLLLGLMVFGCKSLPKVGKKTIKELPPVEREEGVEYKLVLLHTNDHHGATLSKDGNYGLAERATFIKSVRKTNENVLLLDAGDINTGSALSNMFDAEPDILAYNAIGYDAVTFGNHEFDKSLEKLQSQMEKSTFPWVSANITFEDGDFLGNPYIIKDFPGFRVGVIGLTTLRTLTIANPDSSLVFGNEIETAAKYVEILKNQLNCDVIIVLGHLGDVLEEKSQITSQKLAETVSGIDIIVDGHAHTKMETPLVVNGTYIVSANEWGKVVGMGTLTVKDGVLVGFDWKAEEITTEKYPRDGEIATILAPFEKAAESALKEVVLQTTEEFIFGNKLSRKIEIPLGNFVSDAQVAYLESRGVKVDFGFTNGGNIRASLPKGDVTRENILTVLPFENYVYVVTLKGSDVIDLFNFIGSINQGAGGFAQVSKEVSYTITYDETGMNGEISNVLINGKEIDPTATYKIAVNDYLAGGGDGYEALTKSIDTFNTSMLMSDIVIEYAKSLGTPISPKTENRITIIGGIDIQ